MSKPLDPVSSAIDSNIRSWLAQHGYALCKESDTQYPLLGADLDKLLREVSRNACQAVLLVLDEEQAA